MQSRHVVFFAAAFLALAPSVTQAQAPACTTTLTGKVFAPNNIDPLPNILVYIPTTAVQPFINGVQSCSQSLQLVSGVPLVSTLTSADGSFTLTSPGLAGTNIPLVIQAGKWRRQVTVSSIPACSTTSFSTRMPQTHLEGDIPQFAIVTGIADQIECSLRKVGIADSEFTNPASAQAASGRINLYLGTGAPGAQVDPLTPPEVTLTTDPVVMNGYDIIMLPCQGNADPKKGYAKTPAEQANLINYTNLGGRMFATHYSYVWLYNDPPFEGTAQWTGNNISLDDGDATISSSFADAQVLAQWLLNVGASNTLGQVPLKVTKLNQTGVIPPTQSWFTLNDPIHGNPVMQFTFDTPITGTQLPSVTISFTNSPVYFHQGDLADSITINISNPSITAADPSLTLHLALAKGLSATKLAGQNPGSGWACSTTTLTCNRTAPLAGGAADPVALVVAIDANAPIGNEGVATVSITGGGLSDVNQCGRVLFNEYHVENPPIGPNQRPIFPTGKNFPTECLDAPMTPQEKLLEYSLFDLSNFVAPIAVDTTRVQATPVLAWAVPAPIFAGTPLSATQLDATASVPGTFTYTPPSGSILPVGQSILSVLFTPTDTVSYTTATLSVPLQVNLNPSSLILALCVDNPGSLFPCGNPIAATPVVSPITLFYGQTIDGVALESTNNLTGTIVFHNGPSIFCTINANLLSGSNSCPPNSGIFHAGSNVNYAQYIPSPDAIYAGSVSNSITVTVAPDPTTAVLTTSLTPQFLGQPVTFSASLAGNYAIPTGAVRFFADTTPIGTAPLDATGLATFTTSSLTLGNYAITAVYAGTPDFLSVTSAPLAQRILPVPIPVASLTTLRSDINPSPLGGRPITFTANVTVPGPFPIVPPGSVTFSDGATVLGFSPLDARGNAIFSISSLTLGTHPITAAYQGAPGNIIGSPIKPPSPIRLPAPLATPAARFGIQLTAPGMPAALRAARPAANLASDYVIAPSTTPLSPSVAPQASDLHSSQQPSSRLNQLSPTQVVSNIPLILPSVSATLNEVIVHPIAVAPAGFVVTVTPAPATIQAGRTAIFLVTVRPVSGFRGAVQLSCSDLPTEAVCRFVQPNIPPGGGATTLQLFTAAPHDCNDPANPYFAVASPQNPLGPSALSNLRGISFAAPALAGLFLLFLPNRRKLLANQVSARQHLTRNLLILAALFTGLAATSGCGHCTDLGTRPGTYTFHLTATSSGDPSSTTAPQNNLTQMQPIDLIVTIP